MSTLPPEPDPPTGEERDWDAEFREITAHLVVAPRGNARPEFHAHQPEVRARQDDENEADEFVPDAPAPLEHDDPALVIMLAAFLIGPLWLIYLTVFDRSAPTLWWITAALILVLGFGLAIARQPKSRDADSLDDGARR